MFIVVEVPRIFREKSIGDFFLFLLNGKDEHERGIELLVKTEARYFPLTPLVFFSQPTLFF